MSDIQAINLDEEEYERVPRELPKDIELNLSVFRCDYKWTTWYGFWENIKWFFRSWKPAWHRATKGYCRMDTWNVDYSLTAYLIKVLIEYRNVTDGWPFPHFKTFKEWIDALDECIDLLIFSMRDTDSDELCPHYTEWAEKVVGKTNGDPTEEQIAIREAYTEEVNAAYQKQCEAREKAFAFIGKYLPHIWW